MLRALAKLLRDAGRIRLLWPNRVAYGPVDGFMRVLGPTNGDECLDSSAHFDSDGPVPRIALLGEPNLHARFSRNHHWLSRTAGVT